MNSFTSAPLGGIDWGSEVHALAVLDSSGSAVQEMNVPHDKAGIENICTQLTKFGVKRVAIERPDGPVVDALFDNGFEVVVVSSRSVKGLRSRYGTSGNKCDRSDAFILADCLRTDGHRWQSLQPDSPETISMRKHVRSRKMLVENKVGVENQLRAHLAVVFPGALGLFSRLDGKTSLAFLKRFPDQQSADWLSEKRLGRWLKANGYNFSTKTDVLYSRLMTAPKGASTDGGAITIAFVNVIISLLEAISSLEEVIAGQLAAHPDGFIFQSLPRSGSVRAATLLAEIGDCRSRFPDAETLACLSGVAPSTRQSGKFHSVSFRFSSDSKLRNAICDFADGSRHGNAWAAHRYQELAKSGKSHQHIVRILARSWLGIIWRCWQDRVAYDPARHGGFMAMQADAA